MPKNDRSILIGQKIRQAREEKGWSQDALADELDTQQATIARWESGTFPKRFGLPRIAAALDKPIEWFHGPTMSVGEFDARLKALEERANIASIARASTTPLPPEVVQNWDQAGPSVQAICLYLLTGENGYKENLAHAIKSRLETLVPFLGRGPWSKLSGR